MMPPLVRLAVYLTDNSRVMQASVKLEMDAYSRLEAEDFFALRQAFGVEGYMSSGDALTAIQDTIANDVLKA